jgi:hypothetical protein
VLQGIPGGGRRRRKPRKRWLDDVEADLRKMKVKGWRRKSLDRISGTHVKSFISRLYTISIYLFFFFIFLMVYPFSILRGGLPDTPIGSTKETKTF